MKSSSIHLLKIAMRYGFFLFCVICAVSVRAQSTEQISSLAEQQFENLSEMAADQEVEDDSFIQQMQYLLRHPINLNKADRAALMELRLLTALQIENFFLYRKQFGEFLSIYELQAIPSFDIATLQKIRLYITVSDETSWNSMVGKRLRGGTHTFLIRASQQIEKSSGYQTDSNLSRQRYLGSPQRWLIRYSYNWKKNLQYGFSGEKDPGEQFFKGKQKLGFDFYGLHFFIQNKAVLRAFALGDYVVNLGQGLIQWQGLAFKKSADISFIKRQSAIFKPYLSAGEFNFHRGIAFTFAKENRRGANWQTSLFLSIKKLDANLLSDTTQQLVDYVSSLQSSGYHRTNNEMADKGVQRQLAVGGNISYHSQRGQIGLNGIQYYFKLPLVKENLPYNLFAINGKRWSNYSIDYSYTYKNLHFFGEGAITGHFDKAILAAFLLSAARQVDISLLYRNIQSQYQSLYSNAFTENSTVNNEKGLFAGINVKASMAWIISAYIDVYRFPWLRYRVDAPGEGQDYQVQVSFRPNKQLEIYSRYRMESKPVNEASVFSIIRSVIKQKRQNWRTQINYKVNRNLVLRNRVEMLWFGMQGLVPELGFLAYSDILFKPMLKPYSMSLRCQFFESDSYNSRLYAFENDLLYSFSIPVFYDKGLKYYLNANFDINKNMTIWARFSKTVYSGKTLIGTGLDEIRGNKKTEFKVQLTGRF